MADYVASKFALIGLHESLRYELDQVCEISKHSNNHICITYFEGSQSRYKAPRIRTTLVAPGYVQTPMFSRSGYAAREPNTPMPAWLFRFLAPQLAPHDVVKRIIAALDLHQSQHIMMPFYTNLAMFMSILPTWARDFLQWVRVSHPRRSATILRSMVTDLGFKSFHGGFC